MQIKRDDVAGKIIAVVGTERMLSNSDHSLPFGASKIFHSIRLYRLGHC